jgi:hypothetical protein
MTRLPLILALFLAAPAWADTVVWDITPGTEKGACDFRRGIDVCFADFDDAEASVTIYTAVCENWSARWISNIDDTSHDNVLTVRASVSHTASVNTSEIVNNAFLTGDPADDLDVLAGYDSPWLYAVVTTHVTGTGRLSLQCFKRAN